MIPREEHLKAVTRILSYLKTFPKWRLIIDTTYPDHSIYPAEDLTDCMQIYPDVEEEIPNDFPASTGAKTRMIVYLYAD
jgi:hypothetical protein